MTQNSSFVAEFPKLSWAVIGACFVVGFFSPRWTGWVLPDYPHSLAILLTTGLIAALAAGGHFARAVSWVAGAFAGLFSALSGLGTSSVLVQVFGS